MTETEVLHRIEAILKRSLKNGAIATEITRDSTAETVQGWDSLTHAVIIMGVETDFGVELPMDETLEMSNVGDLVDLIMKSKTLS